MGNKVSLEEEMINLRIVSKQMQRSAKKCEKNEKAALEKLKKAIKQGNSEGARIYGQDAIREKNQALNHLRMASRIDACSSRIETAVRMNQVTDGMKGVVRAMDKGLSSMKIDEISKMMDKFEQQFEDLDVKTQYSTCIHLYIYILRQAVVCVCLCLFLFDSLFFFLPNFFLF